jgi:molecular chaperone IbpA
LKDGVLSIELMREIPEAMKPRKIRISSVTGDTGQPQARPAIANDDGIQLEAKQ